MTPLIQNFKYRPEIDGLRAIAVLAVVLFHADLGLSGGYIGVDIFFVVSGFLITSLIIKDLQEGKFAFSAFWERRARRIIPAMAVVVIATLIAGWFLLLPSDYAKLGKTGAYQAVFAANIHFWHEMGYFNGPAEEKPLLHTWSLAVEEQFYLFVPLILFSIFRFNALRKRNSLLLLFAAGLLLSLGASIYGVARHPSLTFYLLPTRAWELLCGCFVALLPSRWSTKARPLREFLCWTGLLCILIPCWCYTKTTLFPGLAAVPPCLGALLFIWATKEGDNRNSPPLILARLLSLRPIVFIGLISYSLYLWHWPLLAFSKYWALEPLSLGGRLLIVALGLFLAVLSWRFVETPFRKRIICATRPAMLGFAGACILVVFVSASLLVLGHGFPMRMTPEANLYARVSDEKAFTHQIRANDIRAGKLVLIGNPDPAAPIRLLVWGDSHAMAAMPAFDEYLKEKGLSGRQATISSTAPILGTNWLKPSGNSEETKAFNDSVFNYIQANNIPDVVLIARWELYFDDKANVSADTALVSTVERLVKAGVRPWIFAQVPHPTFNVPRVLALQTLYHRDLLPLVEKPNGWNGLHGSGRTIFEKLEAAGGHILDSRPRFLDSTGSYFIYEKNGMPLYRDVHHLSVNGAETILLPFLRETLHLSSAQQMVRLQSPSSK
jgi:peptidoglycan/LPS O-acetylase OafA/YrhL